MVEFLDLSPPPHACFTTNDSLIRPFCAFESLCTPSHNHPTTPHRPDTHTTTTTTTPRCHTPSAPIDAAAVNEYLSVLKAMGASEPEGLDDATLAQILEGEEPEEVRRREEKGGKMANSVCCCCPSFSVIAAAGLYNVTL